MVDGVGKNPQQQTIKLKGKDGKSIDLGNLKGLQKTKGNEALFKMYDKDGDGVINDNEALIMQKSLYSLSNGNGKISQREMKALFGDNNKAAFEALSKLSDQQATAKGSKYTEVNGNTTTSFYNSNFGIEGAQREDVTTNPDGSTITKYQDGSSLIKLKDGSSQFIKKDGTITKYDKAGNHTGTITPDGTEIAFPDANTAIWTKDGQKIKTVQNNNGKEVTTNFGDDGQVTSITVSGRGKDGDKTYSSEMTFNSEADFQNNRPASEVRNKGLPTETNITYKYDANGNVQADSVNSAGEKTTTYKNANGEEIKPEEFNASPKEESYSYKVPNGYGITQIVTENLKQQGIENPTKEQIKEARKQLVEANADQVHTMKNGKYKGNQYFLAGAEIKMPKFNFEQDAQKLDSAQTGEIPEGELDGGELAEVTVTAKKPSPETIARRKELQAQFGDNYEVGYTRDGSIEVRDKNGTLLADLTEKANSGLQTTDIPEDGIDGGELAEVTITAKKPSPETIAKRQELQAMLGENYEVGYTRDGSIEVRDKNGTLLADLTEKANSGLQTTDIPEDGIDGGELAEVTITAKKPSPETIAKRQELQAMLGENYEVGYTRDGSIEVRDKNGVLLTQTEINNLMDDPNEIKRNNENPGFNPDDNTYLA